MSNNRGKSPSHLMQLTYRSLNANSFQPQARFKPEAVVKLFALMVRSHICGEERNDSLQVQGNEQTQPRNLYLPLRDPVMGRHGNGDNLGSDLSHITLKSCLQQGENGRAGSNPSAVLLIALPRKALHRYQAYASDRLCMVGRASLSFFFFTSSAFLRMNKMYRSHPVTTE